MCERVRESECVSERVFLYTGGDLNLNTQTHGDLCHGGDLN